MTVTYQPKGVCASQMVVEVENGVVMSLEVTGGCSGNLQGLSRLVPGMRAEEVITRLDGVHCGPRDTSCPDQLAQALKRALEGEA